MISSWLSSGKIFLIIKLNFGLIRLGTLDKKFRIFDADNGEELWSYKLPYIGSSPPVTYQIENEQYILINATGSFSLKKGYPNLVKFGNKILVFKIKK